MNTTKFSYKNIFSLPSEGEVKVDVLCEDILKVHRDVKAAHPNKRVLLLNMANAFTPGGQYDRQKGNTFLMGQEEYLFDKTTLGDALTRDFYPIRTNEVLLTTGVTETATGTCIDVISCPSIDMSYKQHGSRLTPTVSGIMYRKIKLLFQVAVSEGYDILILSALGCGGFAMPPEAISHIFQVVINEYKGYFTRIVFAIKSGDNHPKSNYNVFRKRFT